MENTEYNNKTGITLPLSIGDKVTDFKFNYYQDGKFQKGKMSDYEGKWTILFFYPADFTFVCPTELEELANSYELFQKEGAEIISVSTDTEFTHKAWHDSSVAIGKVKYPMAADPTGEMAIGLGTYIKGEGLSLRGTFIISPEGIIKSIEINDNSIGRSASELLRKVQAAKFVAEHAGLVCPASWKPGADTLEPSEELVGKI
jgi:peroxiredoxin